MNEVVKAALLEAGEELAKLSIAQTLLIAKAYSASTPGVIDDTIVMGIEKLNELFLKDLVEKINPNDGVQV